MIPVLLEIHTDDSLDGCSVRGSIPHMPTRGDRLRVESEVSPDVYRSLSETFTSLNETFTVDPDGTLYFEVMFTEQHVFDEQARQPETVPVIHVALNRSAKFI